jgi:hypothetical protein
MFHREKLGMREAFPNSPGRPKAIGAIIMIQDAIRRLDWGLRVKKVKKSKGSKSRKGPSVTKLKVQKVSESKSPKDPALLER